MLVSTGCGILSFPWPFEGFEGFSWRARPCLSASTIFSRPMRLSKLSCRIGVSLVREAGPGLDLAEELACSLCCQQYKLGSLGSSTRSWFARLREAQGDAAGDESGAAASGRRHGRPPAVIPRHVVAGFFESDRPIKDSGVFGMNGILCAQCLIRFVQEIVAIALYLYSKRK